MRTVTVCECHVFTVRLDATATEIADEMDENSVGCVVVVDEKEAPVGIVTDRDLLRRVVAAGRDPDKTTAADVATRKLVTASPKDPLAKVVQQMKEHGVRRLPIVEGGRAVGIVTLEDVLLALASDVWNVAEGMRIEIRDSVRGARRRRVREQREEALAELRCQAQQVGHDTRDFLHRELSQLLHSLRREK
jgi:CBS domain-containing protein